MFMREFDAGINLKIVIIKINISVIYQEYESYQTNANGQDIGNG